MKHTKQALFHSIVALILCCSMLVGTTFAWFTDEVTSGVNKIQAGNLDIELEYLDGGDWKPVKSDKSVFPEGILWEPGHTEVVYLRIVNKGNLALKYQLGIGVEGETLSVTESGEVIQLSKYIHFGAVDGVSVPFANRDAARAAVTESKALTAGYTKTGTMTATNETAYMALVVYMPESVGNEANHATGADAPSINMGIRLLATQLNSEMDSFGSDYDANAAADFFPGFQGGSAGATVNVDAQGLTTAEVGMAGGEVSAVIPAGVQLADGVNSLALSVAVKETSEANIQLSENEKMRPVDVHIEGVGAGNAVPMLITLKQYLTTGINTGALKLYHVENGTPVAMTQVANPTNHNEFSYDPATGDVTLALASFSEVAVVADTNNPWDGSSQPFTLDNAGNYRISSAGQLAYFRDIVDGKTVVEGLDPTFAGKTVKLTNNITLSGVNFDPIGWGYVNSGWNRDGADGKVFMGTFDAGQYDGNGNLVGRNTIFDLKQSGWDLEDPDQDGKPDADYTYTNCGFGLFAAASGATFKNLTISGAYVRAECVEMGVLVGLSQNNCTYTNIKILDSKIANYQRPAGGLIGEVSGDGTTTITNVTIGSDVVVGSLWGDFDAPVGGVIGARWDDQGKNPQIVMSYVDVGCRLDVYNDITSAYQWHAYRRAGMLIGNTELTDPNNAHLADAPFLTCVKDNGKDTVKVYYGDWVNYTYCNFSNHNPRYPWVRTQAGENCSAFSNPRWGVPNDAEGNLVTDMNHVHQDGDECNVLRQFSQLYGGGQGVYGKDEHPGVEVVKSHYSITYVNDGKTLDIIYVTDNSKKVDVANDQAKKLVDEWATENMKDYNGFKFGGWMTAASVKLDEIPQNNTQNIVLYPYFTSPYTASFVDENSNILAWCFFNEINVDNLSATFEIAKQNRIHPGEDFELDYWKIRGTDLKGGTVNTTVANNNTNWESFKGYKDVTITPHYKYKGADLIEVYDELTGEIDHYEVAGYAGGVGSTMVEIPAYVNGAPVTTVNADAFSSYDHLHSVVIPGSITAINYQSFTANNGTGRDTVTLYYQGNPDDWNAAMNDYNDRKFTDDSLLKSGWDNYMGEGSCVFFLDANGKVDLSKGYWELAKVGGILGFGSSFKWQYHNHAYGSNSGCGNEHNNKTDYTANCKCDLGTHVRPDKDYWTVAAN